MISQVCTVAATGVFSVALRSFQSQALFRIGTLGLVATSFLAGWLLGGSLILGAVFASTWFLLPWLEILTRVRRLRLPLNRALQKCPPPPHNKFPDFSSLSDEMESIGFEYVDDVDWSHGDTRHFYRLFYDKKNLVTASICLLEQDQFSFFYVTFTSRSKDGRLFLTWNYPFSYAMHLLPHTTVNKVDEEMGVEELALSHMNFLSNQASVELASLEVDRIRSEIENELRTQLEHNISRGILVRGHDQMIRYSLRGMFFLWGQFLREFVRFS